MAGKLNVLEQQKEFNENNVTQISYKLEKEIKEPYAHIFDVYEFVTVKSNGNMFIKHYEENIDKHNNISLSYIYKVERLGNSVSGKEKGNKKYKMLKNNGYKFTGIYELDICGYGRRIK